MWIDLLLMLFPVLAFTLVRRPQTAEARGRRRLF